jgi:hypothetical protein
MAIVLAMMSQTGGKGTAHLWCHDCANIGLLSYLAVQVYEPSFQHHFRAVHLSMAGLQTYSFSLVESEHFLMLLPAGSVTTHVDGRDLLLSPNAYTIFSELNVPSVLARLNVAVQGLDKARRKARGKDGGADQG